MKKIYTTTNESSLEIRDFLTELLRFGAQKMLRAAIEDEVKIFLDKHEGLRCADGLKRVVRNGYLPRRNIQTGIGQIEVDMPRVRDRGEEKQIKFSSNLVPKYMRRTVTLDVMLPLMYLKGISEKDFQDVLEPMLGAEAKGVSPSVISKLKAAWLDEYNEWNKRDLSNKQYVYFWVDGIYLGARMETEKSCVLVIIGADAEGNKELVGLTDGFRESKESWKSLLQDMKSRGLAHEPRIVVGDGALGFWSAANEVYPQAKQQRCWVHKTANVLDKLPKAQQPRAKTMLHNIYFSATKSAAEKAMSEFTTAYQLKYPKATECLVKDKDELLAFYDFPAEHWSHLRTTNPIESTFATVRHRTEKCKGCFSRGTILASVFKLCKEAEKRWNKLKKAERLRDVISNIKFVDGIADSSANNHHHKIAGTA